MAYQELLTPHIDIDTSQGFELPFLIAQNRKALSSIPNGVQTHLAVGVGAGGDIRRMQELGKYAKQSRVVGLDIEHSELIVAKRRFPSTEDAKYFFIQGTAENLPVPDASIDILTFLNTWHLFKDLQGFFREAKRVLKKGGRAVGNSAYVFDFQYPDPIKDAREWGSPIVYARMDLKKQRAREKAEDGETDIPERIDKPDDPARYSKAQVEAFAQEQGLVAKATPEVVLIGRPEAGKLFMARELANGVLPGVPLPKARPALYRGVERTFEEKGLTFLRRYWTTLEIENPA